MTLDVDGVRENAQWSTIVFIQSNVLETVPHDLDQLDVTPARQNFHPRSNQNLLNYTKT